MDNIVDSKDNMDGWIEWIERDNVLFGEYCFEHFWDVLRDDYNALLHPEQRRPDEPNGPDGSWEVFLLTILEQSRRKVLVEAFIDSNLDDFEQWAIDSYQEEDYDPRER